MSAEHRVFPRSPQVKPTPLADPERKSDNYYCVTTSEPQEMGPVTFAELLKGESGSYETVIENDVGGSQTQTLCPQCRQPIRTRPFCYNCYGPKKLDFKGMVDGYKWILMGVCLLVAILMCFLMCLMHMYNFGVYRDEKVVVLEREIRVVKSLLRLTTAYSDGFMSQTVRNMTVLQKDVNQINKQLTDEKDVYKGIKGNLSKIEQLLFAGCEEYLLKTTSTSKVGKACGQIKNGTYFT